jgi:hypothetical protein
MMPSFDENDEYEHNHNEPITITTMANPRHRQRPQSLQRYQPPTHPPRPQHLQALQTSNGIAFIPSTIDNDDDNHNDNDIHDNDSTIYSYDEEPSTCSTLSTERQPRFPHTPQHLVRSIMMMDEDDDDDDEDDQDSSDYDISVVPPSSSSRLRFSSFLMCGDGGGDDGSNSHYSQFSRQYFDEKPSSSLPTVPSSTDSKQHEPTSASSSSTVEAHGTSWRKVGFLARKFFIRYPHLVDHNQAQIPWFLSLTAWSKIGIGLLLLVFGSVALSSEILSSDRSLPYTCKPDPSVRIGKSYFTVTTTRDGTGGGSGGRYYTRQMPYFYIESDDEGILNTGDLTSTSHNNNVTTLLLTQHGWGHNGHKYACYMAKALKRAHDTTDSSSTTAASLSYVQQFKIIAPQFTWWESIFRDVKGRPPGFDPKKDLYWSNRYYQYGANSVTSGNVPDSISSYEVYDQLIQQVSCQHDTFHDYEEDRNDGGITGNANGNDNNNEVVYLPNLQHIKMVGFSGGGQFAQRYAIWGQGYQQSIEKCGQSQSHTSTGGSTVPSMEFIIGNPNAFAYLDEYRPVLPNVEQECRDYGFICGDPQPHAKTIEFHKPDPLASCPHKHYNSWGWGIGSFLSTTSNGTATNTEDTNSHTNTNSKDVLLFQRDQASVLQEYPYMAALTPAQLQRGIVAFGRKQVTWLAATADTCNKGRYYPSGVVLPKSCASPNSCKRSVARTTKASFDGTRMADHHTEDHCGELLQGYCRYHRIYLWWHYLQFFYGNLQQHSDSTSTNDGEYEYYYTNGNGNGGEDDYYHNETTYNDSSNDAEFLSRHEFVKIHGVSHHANRVLQSDEACCALFGQDAYCCHSANQKSAKQNKNNSSGNWNETTDGDDYYEYDNDYYEEEQGGCDGDDDDDDHWQDRYYYS